RRVQEVEHLPLEVGGRQAVGNQDDLTVGRVLARKQAPRDGETMLDVREMGGDVMLADVLSAHVGRELNERVSDGDWFRHQLDHPTWLYLAREAVELHKAEVVARVFRSQEPLQREGHPLDVDV